MAIAFDTGTGHSATNITASLTSAGVAVTVTVVAGEFVVVFTTNHAGLTVAAVTDGTSNVYRKFASDVVSAADSGEVWGCYAKNAASTVTVTWNSPSGSAAAAVAQYTGVLSTGYCSGFLTSAQTSVAEKISEANNFVVAGFGRGGNVTLSITTGTSRLTNSVGSGGSKFSIALGDNTSATAGTSTSVAATSANAGSGLELRLLPGIDFSEYPDFDKFDSYRPWAVEIEQEEPETLFTAGQIIRPPNADQPAAEVAEELVTLGDFWDYGAPVASPNPEEELPYNWAVPFALSQEDLDPSQFVFVPPPVAPDIGLDDLDNWFKSKEQQTLVQSLESDEWVTPNLSMSSVVGLSQTGSDNFTRANENPLSDGGNWAQAPGVANPLQLVSNLAEATAVLANNGSIWSAIQTPDQYCQVTVQNCDVSSFNATISLGIRMSATPGGSSSPFQGYFIDLNGLGSNFLSCYVRYPNSTTSFPGAPLITVNVGDVFRLQVANGLISVFQNGIKIFSANDGNKIVGGSPAVLMFPHNAVTQTQISAWSGGAVTTVAQPDQGFWDDADNFYKVPEPVQYQPDTMEEFVTPNLSMRNVWENQLASDNFQRANENPLSNGGNWGACPSLSTSVQLQLVSNLVEAKVVTNCGSSWIGNPWSGDHYNRCTIATLNTNATIYMFVRMSAVPQGSVAAFQGYELALNGPFGNTATWVLTTVTANTQITILSGTGINQGDTWELRAFGCEISVYQNRVLLGVASDATVEGGVPAMVCNPRTVVAAAQISAWSGGSVFSASQPDQAFQDESDYEDVTFDWHALQLVDEESDRQVTPPVTTPNMGFDEIEALYKPSEQNIKYDHVSETDEPGGLTPPPTTEQDEISEKWIGYQYPAIEDDWTQRAPNPPFAIDQDTEQAKWVAWAAPIIEDDWATFPPAPPQAIDQDTEQAKWVAWGTWIVEDDWNTNAPTPPFVIIEDGEQERRFDWSAPALEDDQRNSTPTPPFTLDQDTEQAKWVAWYQFFIEDDYQTAAPTPPFVIGQDGEEAKWIAWSSWIVEDDYTTRQPTPPTTFEEEYDLWVGPPTDFELEDEASFYPVAPPFVFSSIGQDDIEAHIKAYDKIEKLIEDDLSTQAPTPPFAIDQDSEQSKWVAWSAPAIEDDWATYPPTPPFVIPQDGEEGKWVAWTSWIVEEDNRQFPPTPPFVIIEDGEQERRFDWASPAFEEDLSSTAPTPPFAIGQDAEELKWVAWSTWAIEDDWNIHPPAPPQVVAQDGEELKWVGWWTTAVEDDWTARQPTPPQAIDQDNEQSIWVAWSQIFQTDEETQRDFPPTPPVTFEEEYEIWAGWESPALEDDWSTKFIVPPPIITQGYDDIEAHIKAYDRVEKYYEDDWSTAAPRPPFTSDTDDVSDWVGWSVPAIEDDYTQQAPRPPFVVIEDGEQERRFDWSAPALEDDQRNSTPTPPFTIDQDTEQAKWVAWSAPAIEDDYTQQTPAPPQVIDQEAQEAKWVGWSSYAVEEDLTSTTPRPPFVVIEDGELERLALDWKSPAIEDDASFYPVVPPVVAPNVGYDDIEAHYHQPLPVIPAIEDDQANRAPTPPFVLQDEISEKWTAWSVPAIEDDWTQRAPNPPSAIAQHNEQQHWVGISDPALEDDWTTRTPTPPPAIDQDSEQSKWVGTSAPALEDDQSNQTPPPPPAIQDEISEEWVATSAFQYDDMGTVVEQTPLPYVSEVEELVDKWTAWVQNYHSDEETQQAIPPTPPFVIIEDGDLEKWYGWAANLAEEIRNEEGFVPPPPSAAVFLRIQRVLNTGELSPAQVIVAGQLILLRIMSLLQTEVASVEVVTQDNAAFIMGNLSSTGRLIVAEIVVDFEPKQ